ncbi:hypothetical protein [Geomonas sp.]|uniref:hypothetical protein n=1 Tax=Geomonas sp. TaxID=2651584 RepID=UPI002B479ED1|nr:hypothetical protein [Geomonas sp.]HJV34207.1 hypothetical protein [Geomonas sp.]
MSLIPSSSQLPPLFSVLKLFLIPVGGGIPAGVLLARAGGLAWPVTTLLYLLSDLILVLAFEPCLRLLALVGRRISLLARVVAAIKQATARSAERFSGTGAGPISLVMISFGVDPMTGRASALAGGYGFIAGWAFAIAGDMLYFAVIAVTTLQLNTYIKDPETTMLVVLAAMFLVPVLVRRLRSAQVPLPGR